MNGSVEGKRVLVTKCDDFMGPACAEILSVMELLSLQTTSNYDRPMPVATLSNGRERSMSSSSISHHPTISVKP